MSSSMRAEARNTGKKKKKSGTRSKTPQPPSLKHTLSSEEQSSKSKKKRPLSTPSSASKSSTKLKPKTNKTRPLTSPIPRKSKNKNKQTKPRKTRSKSPSAPSKPLKTKKSKSKTPNNGIDQRPNLSPTTSTKIKRQNQRNSASYSSKKSLSKKKEKYRSFYGDMYKKEKLKNLYKVKEKIGSGTFSIVRRGIRRSDKCEVAIKIITKTDLNETEFRLIEREIGIMQKLDHSHIVALYDIFETLHHLYLVIEYCPFGELFDELINCTPNGWFSERETSQIIRQIAEALKYMHSKHIIHRDLKLENVLIWNKKSFRRRGESIDNFTKSNAKKPNLEVRRHSERIKAIPSNLLHGDDESQTSLVIKISDFGLSKQMNIKNDDQNDEESKENNNDGYAKKMKMRMKSLSKQMKKDQNFAVMATNCGTLYYVGMNVAPEILNGEAYNEKVDCWSLGVICYVLLCGSLPFYSENELEISDLILRCEYDLGQTDSHWHNVSDSAKDLIKNLLTLDKNERYSASKVLAHPFITGINKLTAMKRKSLKWNAGKALLGKWTHSIIRKKDIWSSKLSFGSGTDSNSDFDSSDYENDNLPPSPNKKIKYKINIDANNGQNKKMKVPFHTSEVAYAKSAEF